MKARTDTSAPARKKPSAPTAVLDGRARGRARDEAAFPLPPLNAALPANYARLVGDIKARIRRARLTAAAAVNQEILLLYHSIGSDLDRRIEEEAWGSGIIDRVSADLRAAFPEMDGLSPRNLRRMRAFYRAYPPDAVPSRKRPPAVARSATAKWPPVVAKLPWAHNVVLLEKVKNPIARTWYACTAFEEGWSRNVLALQIDGRLYERKGKATTNFRRTLPAPQSDLAQEITSDPYQFGVAECETQIVEKLPEELKSSLPTAEEIEAELGARGMS